MSGEGRAANAPTVLGPGDGRLIELDGLGIRFLLDGAATGDGFALVEHPIAPCALAAPIHTHRHEDEYTFVLEGAVGVQVGEEVRVARPGDLVSKPRGIPHAFWNAGEEPARALEIISPAGFERYFEEIASLLPPAVPAPDEKGLAEVMSRYGLEMDFGSVPMLVEHHGLVVAGAPPGG